MKPHQRFLAKHKQGERFPLEEIKPPYTKEEIWLQAWLGMASAANSTRSDSATSWADTCLAEYTKRFL